MKHILLLSVIILFTSAGVLIGHYVIPAELKPSGGYEVPTTVKPDIAVKPISTTAKPDNNKTSVDNISPVDCPVITSPLGVRVSPITGLNSIHYGTDMYSNESMNVYAVKDGIVVLHYPPPDGYFKGHPIYGGLIEILDSEGLSRYGHMSRTFVKEGQHVKAGDIIGIIGNTGLSVGLHLHYERFVKYEF